MTFADIAIRYLKALNYEPYLCEDEDEARSLVKTLPQQGQWPCLFTTSDTTGEKDFEEFFTANETLDMQRFHNLGVIKNDAGFQAEKLEAFTGAIQQWREAKQWTKRDIVALFKTMLPNFDHKETGKYLDSKM
jgi:hypothetical protein